MEANETGLLAVETAYYDEYAQQLLLIYPNRFLLIRGEKVIGDYESRSEAVAEGVRRYGQDPFLVRRTGDKTLELTSPALNLRAEATDRQGRTIAAPAGLTQSRPLVSVTLMISDSHRQIWVQQATSVQEAINGFALIDTGASRTCIGQSAATRAGLPVIDRAMMTSASHATHEVPLYGGKLVISGFSAIDLEFAMGANLDGLNLIVLIWRDLLQAVVLVYNSTDGSISLSILVNSCASPVE